MQQPPVVRRELSDAELSLREIRRQQEETNKLLHLISCRLNHRWLQDIFILLLIWAIAWLLNVAI